VVGSAVFDAPDYGGALSEMSGLAGAGRPDSNSL